MLGEGYLVDRAAAVVEFHAGAMTEQELQVKLDRLWQEECARKQGDKARTNGHF